MVIKTKEIMNLFEVKTKRLTVDESNTYKTVKEQWLVEAETFTEAEANVTKYLKGVNPKDEISFTGMKPSRITELVKSERCEEDEENALFYKCTVLFTGEGFGKRGTKECICAKAIDIEDANMATLKFAKAGDEEATNVDSVKVEKTRFTGVIVHNRKTE